MAFDVIASSYREREKERTPLAHVVIAGLSFGGVAIFSALVGILYMFHERWIFAWLPPDAAEPSGLTLGQFLLVVFAMWGGVQATRKTAERRLGVMCLQGAGAGLVAGLLLSVLPLLMSQIKLRFMFISLTPQLYGMLTSGMSLGAGLALLVVVGTISGAFGALLYGLSPRARRPILHALAWAVSIGVFQELIQLLIQQEAFDPVREWFFTWDGLRPQGSLAIALAAAAVVAVWDANRERLKAGFEGLPRGRQRVLRGGGMAFLLLFVLILFPMVSGNFIGQVLLFIGLFILMGMGLNLEIGLAGLLDLGFVAFYAVGAYTCALLTADSPYAIGQRVEWFPMFNWWWAMIVGVIMATLIGVLFGIPVLKIRGDYLAVATLGLGEIVRVLVLSDFAAPVLAGAQGILNIPPPYLFGGAPIDDPIELYYIALAAAGVAAYFAYRLENSRLGRAWTAIRDDEDVAQALGINLVNVKLLAYGLGAAFAGLSGAIFATMLTSIYPHSFQLLISINVLALIIVGGMGSLPGVVVGALALIGLPELLREFGEYRYFFYGVAIVAVMRLRPAGLWPSAARRREMQLDEETRAAIEAQLAAEAGGGARPSEAPRA